MCLGKKPDSYINKKKFSNLLYKIQVENHVNFVRKTFSKRRIESTLKCLRLDVIGYLKKTREYLNFFRIKNELDLNFFEIQVYL